MAEPKLKRHQLGGTIAYSENGVLWWWDSGGTRYRWCKLGHVEILSGKMIYRCGFFKQLGEAMAFTLGVAWCAAEHRKICPMTQPEKT